MIRGMLFIWTLCVVMCVHAQDFTFTMTSDTLLHYTTSNNYLTANIVNQTTDTLVMDMLRLQNDMPMGWSSGMCAVVCGYAWEDSMRFEIPPLDTQEYRMYFNYMGSPSADTAHAYIRFRSTTSAVPIDQEFWATQDMASGLHSFNEMGIRVYPNPVSDMLYIDLIDNTMYQELQLFNSLGKLVVMTSGKDLHNRLDLSHLPAGIYHLQMKINNKLVVTQLIRK